MSAAEADRRFLKASPEDTAAAQNVYRRIIDHLGATIDYPRWHQVGHPAPDLIASWINAGELYLVWEDGEIAGVVALNHEAVSAYKQADWAVEAAPEQALVVHALGVVPDQQGRGIARFILDSTIALAKHRGMRAVRLDVYVDNTPALELYSRYGFTDLGCHTVDYGNYDLTQFHLFEYVL